MSDAERLAVYISGPITRGSRNRNCFEAFEAQQELMRIGFAPLNPVASCCYPFAWEDGMSHELWLAADFPWVRRADAVLRLTGYSEGADAEVRHAEAHGVPVFESIDDLRAWRRRMDRQFVLGLVGEPGVGKDEAALGLTSSSLGFRRVSFADPLREALLALNPIIRIAWIAGYARLLEIVEDKGWAEAKQIPEVRRLLQRMGTEAGRGIHGTDCWVRLAKRNIRNAGGPVVVTDVRFPDEAALIRELGGKLVRVRRPGVGCVNNHASELHYDEIACDDTWVNSSTADLWRHNVRRWVRAWMPENEGGEHGRTDDPAAEGDADTQRRPPAPDAGPPVAPARRVGCGGD